MIPGFFDLGSNGWLVGSLLLWIVAFPAYLIYRDKYRSIIAASYGRPAWMYVHCPGCAQKYRFPRGALRPGTDGMKCPQCGKVFRFRQSVKAVSGSAPVAAARLVVLLGAGLILLGCVSPVARLPIVGSITYLSPERLDSIAVLGLACLAMPAVFLGRSMATSMCGLMAALILSSDFLDMLFQIRFATAEVASKLEGNPFAGIASVFMQGMGLQRGWLILFAGALLIVFHATVAEWIES